MLTTQVVSADFSQLMSTLASFPHYLQHNIYDDKRKIFHTKRLFLKLIMYSESTQMGECIENEQIVNVWNPQRWIENEQIVNV